MKNAFVAAGLCSALCLTGCTDPVVSDAIKSIDAIGEVGSTQGTRY